MAIAIYLYHLYKEPYTVALCFFWANFPSLLGLSFCRRWLTTTPHIIRTAVVGELLVVFFSGAMFFLLPHVQHLTLVLTLYIVVAAYLSNISKITHQLFTRFMLHHEWQLNRANTLNEILYNLSWVVAVPLGAWCVKVWSLTGLYLTNMMVSSAMAGLLIVLFGAMHNKAINPAAIDTLVGSPNHHNSLQDRVKKEYKSVFFWNFMRNMTASFMSATMIPLVLAVHSLSDLIWISLVGNVGILLAIYRPLPFEEQHPARLLVLGQLYMSLAALSMLLPWLVTMCLAFLVFSYGIITTNSLEVFILQKHAPDSDRGPLFSMREQMAILGRTSGYVFSACLPWLFMGFIAKPNMLALGVVGVFSVGIAAYTIARIMFRSSLP